MTFLQVWVAAVRESRKLRNQPKLSYAEAFPRTAAAKDVADTICVRNQT
ncbi:hypothetical protein SAMN05216579_0143 [Pseudomonas granadensis]|jgi:hypothetical protein|nr:hypothetical protein SAMN05216579_0143 [Pseudomonas granadensis]